MLQQFSSTQSYSSPQRSMTKILQLLKAELAQSKDISSRFFLVQQHKSVLKLFPNTSHPGLNALAMISEVLKQNRLSITPSSPIKSSSIFIIALESFLGTCYLNILSFGQSILHASKNSFAITISMASHN